MIIGGVHWFVAMTIALVVHLVGIAWLGLGEPIQRIEPDRTAEGIVVTLGRDAGNAGQAARTVGAEQGRPVIDTEELDARRAAEAEPQSAPAAETRAPDPEETAAEPPDSPENPDVVEAAAGPSDAQVAVPEPRDAGSQPASDVQETSPSVEVSESTAVEAVQARDAVAVPGLPPRSESGEGVPVEFAEASTVPETPDAPARAPQAETLWSGTTTESPDAETPTAAAPAVSVARNAPPSGPAETVPGVPTLESAGSTMQIEAVEAGPATVDSPEVAAARQPAPAVERAFEPETSDVAVPETVKLQELQEREVGGAGVVARYAGLIKGWLQKNMHYPRAARLAGQEGDVVVRFIIDREGHVQSIVLESGSGYQLLDREAREMIERGDPFPAIPVEMPGQRLEVRVPVSFHVKDETRQKEIPPIYLE